MRAHVEARRDRDGSELVEFAAQHVAGCAFALWNAHGDQPPMPVPWRGTCVLGEGESQALSIALEPSKPGAREAECSCATTPGLLDVAGGAQAPDRQPDRLVCEPCEIRGVVDVCE